MSIEIKADSTLENNTFESLVKQANELYKHKPIEGSDTKTKLLKRLLQNHSVATGVFSRTVKQDRIRMILTETDMYSDRYKTGSILWIDDKFYTIMDYHDIHDAMTEITAQTGIRFKRCRISAGVDIGKLYGYSVHYPDSS